MFKTYTYLDKDVFLCSQFKNNYPVFCYVYYYVIMLLVKKSCKIHVADLVVKMTYKYNFDYIWFVSHKYTFTSIIICFPESLKGHLV